MLLCESQTYNLGGTEGAPKTSQSGEVQTETDLQTPVKKRDSPEYQRLLLVLGYVTPDTIPVLMTTTGAGPNFWKGQLRQASCQAQQNETIL